MKLLSDFYPCISGVISAVVILLSNHTNWRFHFKQIPSNLFNQSAEYAREHVIVLITIALPWSDKRIFCADVQPVLSIIKTWVFII